MTDPLSVRLERSLRWYPWHQTAAGSLFWLPILTLFYVDAVGLAAALRLQAVYFIAVVVFEVPSGWASDRLGRVATMRVAAVAWIAAHVLLTVGGDTGLFVVAQVLLALGYASLSGTDAAFHHDTLEALGRASEFGRREAAARRRMLLATAASALAGGALGLVDFRLEFATSAVAAAAQLATTSRFVEPRLDGGLRGAGSRRRGGAFRDDLPAPLGVRRIPVVRWLAIGVVVQVTTVHLAADLTGPYLASLTADGLADLRGGAMATGAVSAVVALAGSQIVGRVPALVRAVGIPAAVVLAGIAPVGGLALMALVSTWWLVPLLALRGTQSAAVAVIAPQVVGAHAPSQHRATLLSIMSLGGRLTYGVAALAIAATTSSLDRALTISAVIAAAGWLLLLLTHRLVPPHQHDASHDHEHHHPALHHDHAHRHDDGHHDHEHPEHLEIGADGFHSHPHRHDELDHAHEHTSDAHHHHH